MMGKNKFKFIFSAIFLFGTMLSFVSMEPIEDKQVLIDFIQRISHSKAINWDMSSSACLNWTGITCNHDNSRIIALRLPASSLHGPIPSNTLSRLHDLQILSLRSNGLTGPFPSDFLNLRNLTALYLQSNGFYGPLPLNFSDWNNLSILNLSNNGFNGSIPHYLSNLSHLTALSLANNSLFGEIQNLNIPSLQVLDLSNNNLTGPVRSGALLPGCDCAIEFDLGSGSYGVTCHCSYNFCWNCTEEAHRPVDYETVSKWIMKNSAESENMNC